VWGQDHKSYFFENLGMYTFIHFNFIYFKTILINTIIMYSIETFGLLTDELKIKLQICSELSFLR
jgi:hypothetical protein